MTKKLRVVVDTNVFVSALLGGRCREIFEAFADLKFILIVSEDIAEEFRRVFLKERLKNLSASEAEWLLAAIQLNCDLIKPDKSFNLCRDPKDNCIIEAALAADADFIVTGDKDLLVISLEAVPIISPREFIKILKTR